MTHKSWNLKIKIHTYKPTLKVTMTTIKFCFSYSCMTTTFIYKLCF